MPPPAAAQRPAGSSRSGAARRSDAPPRGRLRPLPRPAGDGRLVLWDVTFAEYVALRDKPANAHHRMTFDGPAGGRLEIEMPQGLLHESVSRLLALLIAAFCEERGLPMRATGSVTQRSERVDRGCESDECFYLASADRIAGKDRLDLDAGDPPPDLVVEVDVTSPGAAKLPIYHALGVPEAWVWADGEIAVYRRGADEMEPADGDASGELPGFPVAEAAAFLARHAEPDQTALLADWRERLRAGGEPEGR